MKFLKLLTVILYIMLLTGCYKKAPIDTTSVLSGVGNDVVDNTILSATYEFLVFKGQNEVSKSAITEEGRSIFDIYNKRLLEIKKSLITGTTRLLLIGEDRAKLGIQDIIDVYLRDQDRNLNTTIAVCKGKAKDLLNMEPNEDSTVSEEIEDLIDTSFETNFTQWDVNIKDLFNMRFQAGRRIMIPYIEKYKDIVKLTSIAVFENDKMVLVIPEDDVKYINLLRNYTSIGYLTFKSDTPFSSTDILCKSKRKVTAYINNDKITYDIKINIKATLKELDENVFKKLDKKTIDTIQTLYSEELEAKLKDIIKKYQGDFNIDVFDIEKYALAKLGEDKETFVKNKFNSAKINVNVNITIKNIGRLIQ
ncbi:Ger(x)C family spore germination protein [Clostridium thermarum]|uniref:Ger(x)C family spore germination protein n=1 Tax=Clostridium thermarum TaxID=1716543 RepID=UPI0013D59C97|nr:Ger(x)C family spore germination protein [Clostridium thermarum]